MELFDSFIDKEQNILPYDGVVNYYGAMFSHQEADTFLERLLQRIAWKHDEAIIFGKKITTKRKVAWYGDEPFTYTYSKVTKQALPWTSELLELKQLAEEKTNEAYNSCLLNLYHSGEEGMAWHRDEEIDLQKNGAICSMSFGAERKFTFKHRVSNEKVSLTLQHGSLLVMKGTTQTHWLHSLPTTRRVSSPRVNLTFRMIVQP
jgi:alkylated DNA repair dioxygenase AlkB